MERIVSKHIVEFFKTNDNAGYKKAMDKSYVVIVKDESTTPNPDLAAYCIFGYDKFEEMKEAIIEVESDSSPYNVHLVYALSKRKEFKLQTTVLVFDSDKEAEDRPSCDICHGTGTINVNEGFMNFSQNCPNCNSNKD